MEELLVDMPALNIAIKRGLRLLLYVTKPQNIEFYSVCRFQPRVGKKWMNSCISYFLRVFTIYFLISEAFTISSPFSFIL
jgi:hypothetical protein